MRLFNSFLSLSLFTLVGCAAEDTSSFEGVTSPEITMAAVPPPACTPRPPVNPLLCNPEEPIAPPPVNGSCTIELRVDSVGFATGQGWLEGRAEAMANFTATNQDTSDVVVGSFPAPGGVTVKMEVDTKQLASIPLGTYVVQANDPDGLDVKVCGAFTETDKTSADDTGIDCETINLTCPQAGDDVGLSADLCKGGDCTKKRGAMNANISVMTVDADRDCVANEDDYTPEPCDEAFKGQLCRASIVYFAYEDGPGKDLIQNVGTDLTPGLTGYDYKILLIDDTQWGPINLSGAAKALADVVMVPSEENFFAALQDVTARGCDVDVWMHAHGGVDWDDDGVSMSIGGGWVSAHSDDDISASPDITTKELLEDTDPANSGTQAVPVRMTYATACNYAEWNQAWLDVGAKVTSGSIDVNFVPTFYGRFASHWTNNQTYAFSVANELSQAAEDLAFSFILYQGELPPWLCIVPTVLNLGTCAENFFIDSDASPILDANGNWVDGPDEPAYAIGGPRHDLAGVAYNTALSGADNMRASSRKIRVGDGTIRKNTPATLTWP